MSDETKPKKEAEKEKKDVALPDTKDIEESSKEPQTSPEQEVPSGKPEQQEKERTTPPEKPEIPDETTPPHDAETHASAAGKEPHKPEQPSESLPQKDDHPRKEMKEASKKAGDQKEDFQYIVRIADTDVDGNRKVVHGLTQIKGIGWHMAVLIADISGVNREAKMGDLSEADIEKIKNALSTIGSTAPPWMMNHRKDFDTGKNIHLISSDVDMRLRDDVNLLKMIRSYRGIRHELGLPVRGQRTRANGRGGLSLGVSRKSATTTK